MRATAHRRVSVKQPKAVAVARTAPRIPAFAVLAAGALFLIVSLALRGLP